MIAKNIEEVDNDDVKYSKNKVDKFKAIYRLKDTGATIIFMSASILINREQELASLLSMMHGRLVTMNPYQGNLNVKEDYDYLTYLHFGFTRSSRENMRVNYVSNTKIGIINGEVDVISYRDEDG